MLKHNKTHDLSREWCESGSSSYSPTVAPKQINPSCQEMVHVRISAGRLNVPAANPLVTILSGIISELTLSCFEECEKSYSGPGKAFRTILFIILLTVHPHLVISCDVSEYEHAGHCCTMCSPEMGLQIKHPCIYTRNTECKPRNGHYCKDKSCQMAFIHKTCPPGEGVKEKGTQFKDTVCEVCPEGTYSSNDSSAEPCVEWTKCEERNQKLVNQGTSKSDAVCKDESNPIVTPVVVLGVIILVAVGIVIYIFCCRKKKFTLTSGSDREAAGTPMSSPMPESEDNFTEQTAFSKSKEMGTLD